MPTKINIQNRFNYLKQKIEAGKSSKFEEHVYSGCEKALEFCKSYLKEQNITSDVPLETTILGVVRMSLTFKAREENPSFLYKLKAAGYRRAENKESVIPPIEPYLLLDIKSPYVAAVNRVFEKTTPKIINKFEVVDWGEMWRSFPQAEIKFESTAKEGLLSFRGDKFSDLNVTIGKSFSMKSQTVKEFVLQLEEYENDFGLKN